MVQKLRLNAIESNYVGKVSDLSVPQLVLSFIPKTRLPILPEPIRRQLSAW